MIEYLLADCVGVSRIVWFLVCAIAGFGIGWFLADVLRWRR